MSNTFEYVEGYEVNNNYSEVKYFDVNLKTKEVQKIIEQPLLAGEMNSQCIGFRISRYCDGIDLSTKDIHIIYIGPTQYRDISAVINVERNEEYVRFIWVVPAGALLDAGDLMCVLEFTSEDYVLKTKAITIKVEDTMQGGEVVSEPKEQEWYQQLQNNYTEAVQKSANAEKTAEDTKALVEDIVSPSVYSRNLLKIEVKTVTNNGMTFTSENGAFSVKGHVNSPEAVAEFATDFTLQQSVYYSFSIGSIAQIDDDDKNMNNSLRLILSSEGEVKFTFPIPYPYSVTTSKLICETTTHIDTIKIVAPAGKQSGIIFYPQLEQGEEATEYQSPDYFVEGHLLIPLAEKSVKMEHLSDEVKDAFASQGNGSGQGEQGFGIYYHDMPIDVDKGLGIGDEVTLGKFGVLANVRVGDFVIFKPVSFPSVMAKVTDTTLWGNGGVSMMVVAVLEGEKGEKGDTGATGSAGADGYTPIKGVDYFTKDDKAEIAQIVIDEFGSEVMALLGEDE